ncbi:MAG: AMP-binding protein [Ignavibacteriaceae bacterium]|nr:AMP-binding protein [Ignavibacteriaceae bacterium]
MSNFEIQKTVWEQWSRNASLYPEKDAIVHWRAGEQPVRWSFKQILQQANKFSALLLKKGIKRDHVCAIIIRHNHLFYPLYMGIAGIGAIPAVLAYPNPRLHPDKFRQGILGMSQRSGLDWILTEEELEPIVGPLVQTEESTIKGLLFPLTWEYENEVDDETQKELDEIRSKIEPHEPFLLQHSSGTTGLQKPVLLSQQAVLRHVKYYGESINFSLEDKVASWLPLYHDMGLIAAYHLPLAFGITSIQIDPFEWVLAPSLLLEAISAEKATLSWLPNFAYNFMADRINEEDMEGINLKTLRLVINCSEPVRHESHTRFLEKFAEYDFSELALSACYAMAETTYGVTQTEPGKNIFTYNADRESLAAGKVIPAIEGKASRVCVSSGKIIEGCQVKIVDEKRNEVENGAIGEIAITSVSMFDGYRNYPEKTAEVLIGEWFYSGDFGFMIGEELFVIGRKKDIIIVAGKNIYPEDVEDIVGKVDGVLPGRVIAFGEDDTEQGTEAVSVVAESNIETEQEKKKLSQDIKRIGNEHDITIKNVYIVPSRWLIKSSAGKPSRKANKERITEMKNFSSH